MNHPRSPRRARGPLIALLLSLLASSDPARAADVDVDRGPDAPSARERTLAAPLSICAGSAEEMGARLGADEAEQIRSLLRLTAVRSLPGRLLHPWRTAALIDALPPDHRREIAAQAQAAGVSERTMLAANVLVDSQCSALVSPATATSPLRVARNLDFFPASVIGPRSLVRVLRPAGKHAFVALGWPGFAGVTSGMNDAGVTACVLLNHDRVMRPGVPVCFRMREILESCTSLDQAVSCFAASPVASSHYVLLADAHGAAVVWQDRHGLHRDDPTQGWLAVANGPRAHGRPLDARGRRLEAVGSALFGKEVTDAQMRQSLTSSYLSILNAQAMVFVPASLTIEVALGTAVHPAAVQDWTRIEAGPLLAGAPASQAVLTDLGRVSSLEHPLTLW
jgi:hypothetical protein